MPGQNRFDANYDFLVRDDSVDSNLKYIGYAQPGSLTSASVWQIERIDCTIGATGRYAEGTDKFEHIFDDRESLSY